MGIFGKKEDKKTNDKVIAKEINTNGKDVASWLWAVNQGFDNDPEIDEELKKDITLYREGLITQHEMRMITFFATAVVNDHTEIGDPEGEKAERDIATLTRVLCAELVKIKVAEGIVSKETIREIAKKKAMEDIQKLIIPTGVNVKFGEGFGIEITKVDRDGKIHKIL